jgi:hypothetical protein
MMTLQVPEATVNHVPVMTGWQLQTSYASCLQLQQIIWPYYDSIIAVYPKVKQSKA